MKSEQGLQPVAKIAKEHERKAARAMGEMLRQAEEQQTQLETLLNYRNEYFEKFTNACKTGLTAIQMQDYQAFLQRLDSAIAQQQVQVSQSKQNCEQSASYWRSKHHHSEMISKVVETRSQQALQEKHSNEQREQDDRNAVAYTNANSNKCR